MEDGKGSFFWVQDASEQTPKVVKHRRKSKLKKLEFVGWGSKLLIEFLQSIGKDIGKKLSQHDVTAIINEYVHTYNLFNPMKKKRVVCDERLRSLFSKNSVPRNKIHELLNSHFAENNDSSEDDDLYDLEEYDDVNMTYKKQKVSSLEKQSPGQKKKASEARLSCFAAIIPENIKLLYLKRSLVQELVTHSESFEGKLLGSYIRIKSDPMDFFQKNSHQLHPVTGVKNVSGIGGIPEVLFQVPNMIKDIPLCLLSDDDFSKEEVEDLCQRVKDGLLKRPTVVEVEQKARTLHEDITKHWLPRELAHLQNLIDRANEKGWRKELFEYLERKKLLQTPSEQSKLLTEVPKVSADKLEAEATPQEQVHDIEQPNTSPIAIHGSHAAKPIKNKSSEEYLTSFQWVEAVQMPKTVSLGQTVDLTKIKNAGSGEYLTSFQWAEAVQTPKTRSLGQIVDLSRMSNVIDLSDDVEEPHEQEDEYEWSCPKWFYRDPQGQIQGPFSRVELKSWSDAGYFMPDFKVWKDGQNPDVAILLTDVLSSNHSK